MALSGSAVQIILLILSLSILVVLHELGHFIPAKLFGTRVSRFYLFFDFLFPFSKVLNFSLFKKKIGDTEYGIGWFPFGGYVQIAGMIDETQSEEDLDAVPPAEQFRFKPAWQRLIVMIGGVTVNMILAMVIYSGLLWAYGQEYLPMKNATSGIIVADSLGFELGLQNGDKIIALDGKPLENFEDFERNLILDEAKTVTIERNGMKQNLSVQPGFVTKMIKLKKPDLIAPRVPSVIGSLGSSKDGYPAEKAGLKVGDKIVAINDTPVQYFDELADNMQKYKNQTIRLSIDRNGQMISQAITPNKEGKIGVGLYEAKDGKNVDWSKYFKTEKIEYNFLAAIPAGIKMSFQTLGKYFKGIKMIFTSKEVKAKDSLGGFYSMGRIFPKTFDWQSFWSITAMISVILAFMNILPIPMLDGGYVLFILIEMIIGKPVNEKIQNYAQMAGMAFILLLLVYANGLDVFRAFSK